MIALTLVIGSLALAGSLLRPTQVQLAFWTQQIILEFLFGCLLALLHRQGVTLSAWTALFLVVLLASRGLTGTDHVDGREPKE